MSPCPACIALLPLPASTVAGDINGTRTHTHTHTHNIYRCPPQVRDGVRTLTNNTTYVERVACHPVAHCDATHTRCAQRQPPPCRSCPWYRAHPGHLFQRHKRARASAYSPSLQLMAPVPPTVRNEPDAVQHAVSPCLRVASFSGSSSHATTLAPYRLASAPRPALSLRRRRRCLPAARASCELSTMAAAPSLKTTTV